MRLRRLVMGQGRVSDKSKLWCFYAVTYLSSLAMMQLTMAVADIFKRLELKTSTSEEDMKLVDTFNGAPATSNIWAWVKSVGTSNA